MKRQKLIGVVLVAIGVAVLLWAAQFSASAAGQYAFDERLSHTGGVYVLTAAAFAGAGLLLVAVDVVRRGG